MRSKKRPVRQRVSSSSIFASARVRCPCAKELLRLKELFETLEYPVLFHCKSGSDRAGLMSALYLHAHCGDPIEEAMRQLSLRYGHIRHADTGVLDHFLECYRADIAKTPMGFFEWAERVYDPAAVTQSFKPRAGPTAREFRAEAGVACDAPQCRSLLLERLGAEERCERAALGDEIGVGADFQYAPLFQHADEIGVTDRR